MKRTIWISTAIATLLVAGSTAIAHGGRGFRHAQGGAFLERIADRLELTETQRADLRATLSEHREKHLRPAMEDVRATREALRATIGDAAAGEDAVRAAARRAAAASESLAVARHNAFTAAWSVLTPEQQKEANQLRSTMEERRRERRDVRQRAPF